MYTLEDSPFKEEILRARRIQVHNLQIGRYDGAFYLANAINDRDFPMSRREIEREFWIYGYSYSRAHIDMCYPQNDEQIAEWRDYESSVDYEYR